MDLVVSCPTRMSIEKSHYAHIYIHTCGRCEAPFAHSVHRLEKERRRLREPKRLRLFVLCLFLFCARSRVARAFRQRTPEQLELCEVSFAGSHTHASLDVCACVSCNPISLGLTSHLNIFLMCIYALCIKWSPRAACSTTPLETHYFLLLRECVYDKEKKLVVLSFAKQCGVDRGYKKFGVRGAA
jgi:hypothetical protein